MQEDTEDNKPHVFTKIILEEMKITDMEDWEIIVWEPARGRAGYQAPAPCVSRLRDEITRLPSTASGKRVAPKARPI